MVTYTDEEIKQVCDAASSVLAGYTDVQNVTFPSTAIISGMKANLSPEEIADNARKAIEDLPLFNNGTYNTIGMNLTMFNYCSFLRGAVYNAVRDVYDHHVQEAETKSK